MSRVSGFPRRAAGAIRRSIPRNINFVDRPEQVPIQQPGQPSRFELRDLAEARSTSHRVRRGIPARRAPEPSSPQTIAAAARARRSPRARNPECFPAMESPGRAGPAACPRRPSSGRSAREFSTARCRSTSRSLPPIRRIGANAWIGRTGTRMVCSLVRRSRAGSGGALTALLRVRASDQRVWAARSDPHSSELARLPA